MTSSCIITVPAHDLSPSSARSPLIMNCSQVYIIPQIGAYEKLCLGWCFLCEDYQWSFRWFRLVSLISTLPVFLILGKYNRGRIWQVLPQIRNGETCQIWTWHIIGKQWCDNSVTFGKLTNRRNWDFSILLTTSLDLTWWHMQCRQLGLYPLVMWHSFHGFGCHAEHCMRAVRYADIAVRQASFQYWARYE